MLDLFHTIRGTMPETADTGTFADGVHTIPAVDLKTASSRDHGRSAYARDYGAQRQVQPQLIGYA